jgi:hypothetical protein
MAEFLTTSGVTFNLERLIKEAREKLVLVSPFVKINERLRQLLEDRDRFKIDIRVVYGKDDLQPAEMSWLKSMASIRSGYCKNLHAKCYLNESEALLTSMNLYEFSQVNNEEMGILVKKADDPALYASVYEEAMRLVRISNDVPVEVGTVRPDSDVNPPASRRSKTEAPEKGVCIRCKTEIKADPARPYCWNCYTIWKRDEDVKRTETFCHLCGNSNKSTINKPVCAACYRKYKNVLAFPTV